MNIKEKKKSKESVSVIFEGEMIINTVSELKEKLSVYFQDVKNMEFDLSGVSKIDTAGFQFLAMIKKELGGKEKKFTIKNPSDEIKRIYNLYGETI